MRGKKAAFVGMRGKREEETSFEQKKRAAQAQVRIKQKDKFTITFSLFPGYCRKVEQISQIF